MEKNFRFVIVGTGNISSIYTEACRKLDGVRIVGAVSRSGRPPKGAGNATDIQVATSLSEIKADFDAVIVATPNGLHHQAAVEAAALGKHVLTEKPLEISVEAADMMISACRENNVRLGVAYQKRFRPDNIAMRRLISENRLGRIFAANLSALFYRDDKYYAGAAWRGTKAIDGGGPFIQQACHEIDIYAWFFGRPAKVASSLDTFAHDIEVEDYGSAILRHQDGMIGTITASTVSWPGYMSTLTIHAEKGTVTMTNDAIQTWNIQGVDNPAANDVPLDKVHSGAGSAHVEETSGHEAVISDFVRAVRENRAPAVSGEEAKVATEIITEIYKNNIL